MGYDRNAWIAQIGICWTVLPTAFLVLPGPGTLAGNVNNVFGWGETVQTAVHPVAWLGIVLLVCHCSFTSKAIQCSDAFLLAMPTNCQPLMRDDY